MLKQHTIEKEGEMSGNLTRLELTWPGKENKANPEPRILIEDIVEVLKAEESMAASSLLPPDKIS